MSNHLLIRADANARMGTGHVMRCLALAQAWQDEGGTVSLAAQEIPEGLKQRLEQERVEVVQLPVANEIEDSLRLMRLARDRAAFVVVDGYQFGIVHQRALKDAGIRQLFIDDYGHASEYVADFILNQNLSAEESLYRNRASGTRLLLGAKYALLRREFRTSPDISKARNKPAHKVVVTMGGSDPDNVTLHVLHSLNQSSLTRLHVKAVLGVANPNREAIDAAAKTFCYRFEAVTNADMRELMLWADVAITATGTTCLELLAMRIAFVGIAWADNQRPTALKLRDFGFRTLLWPEESSSQTLAHDIEALACSSAEQYLFPVELDGKGAERVSRAVLHGDLTVRQAVENDCELLFDWANDPAVRSVSFNQNKIDWAEHVQWYKERLLDSRTIILIGTNCVGEPVGQVRFELKGQVAVIDISVSSKYRGAGYGRDLLLSAIRHFRTFHKARLDAYVRTENTASRRLFEKCGFRSLGEAEIHNSKAIHFTLDGVGE